MRVHVCTIGLLAALTGQFSLAADQPKQVAKQSPSKPVPAKQVATKTPPKAAGVKPTKAVPPKPTKSVTAKSTVAAKPAAKKAPVYPRYYAQMQPAPERYKEIQQALVDKGYFSGSPDGVWGATSTDALKRFQHDQNLNEDGKVDSLSLIALGLGPKRAPTNVEQPATK